MRLVIDKFGIINKASIDINGLTVICGENDTGKSTIGKLIFSLIKSSQKYEDDLEVGAISEIRSSLFKISSLLLLTNDNKETNRLISHNIRRLDPEYLILIKDISILYDNLERAKIDESIR
ncbi:AAA family ATPase, partial [Glaesserella parasuis]|nr:AAA family ATPase [Glaesserella parasuis]